MSVDRPGIEDYDCIGGEGWYYVLQMRSPCYAIGALLGELSRFGAATHLLRYSPSFSTLSRRRVDPPGQRAEAPFTRAGEKGM